MHPPQKSWKRRNGFTLAELLIALAILGVIAAIAIPKLLVTSQNQQAKAMTKEAAGMISAAFQQAKMAGTVTSSTTPSDLRPYLNYVKYVTDGSVVIDGYPGTAFSETCDNTSPCIVLHNGGVLYFMNESFSGTNTTNAIRFIFDANGTQDINSSSDGPGKAVGFILYYDGYFTSRANTKTGTNSSAAAGMGPSATYDPSWYSW